MNLLPLELVKLEMHCHSNHSDGVLSPKELILKAKESGLTHVCITDHDEVSGYNEVLNALPRYVDDIYLFPAVEISSKYENRDLHLLGYFIDVNNVELLGVMQNIKASRAERVFKIIDLINSGGYSISLDDFKSRGLIYNRSNIARICLQKGYATDFSEAFDKFVESGSEFYVEKDDIDAFFALELILNAGGIAVIAHPAHYHVVDTIMPLAKAGLSGIECFHSEQSDTEALDLMKLAKEHNLLVTGGSDFHGDGVHNCELGKKQPPDEYVLEFMRIAEEKGFKTGVKV